MKTRFRVTTQVTPSNGEQPEVLLTNHPSVVARYLKAMYEIHVPESDVRDLLNPDSAISGFSWEVGKGNGYTMEIEVQAGNFGAINLGDVK